MAEFLFRDIVTKRSLGSQFHAASSATSTEEIGNPVHYGTRNKLNEYGISTKGKYAIQLTGKDYDKYDYIIGMDQRNIINIDKIVGTDRKNKVRKLLDFTSDSRDIADPWYTGDFDQTYRDIYEGCEALLDYILIQKENKL